MLASHALVTPIVSPRIAISKLTAFLLDQNRLMIFPWMFDEIHALKPFKAAADLLAKKEDWPPLYDVATLKINKVPVAAAVYYEDMYVNVKLGFG